MSGDQRLKVVLCWHMHQPDYRGPDHGDYQLPWVYLHAIKDYSDMAAHLEANPDARAVVNFAPVLLEQLADYDAQIRSFLEDGHQIRDPLLAACDEALRASIQLLRPTHVVGVGAFARARAQEVLAGLDVPVGQILHPSPASPKANRGWAAQAEAQLAPWL